METSMKVLFEPETTVQALVEGIMREADRIALAQVVAQFLLSAVLEERCAGRDRGSLLLRKGCVGEEQDWGATRIGESVYVASAALGRELMVQCQEWLDRGLRPVLLVPWQLVTRAMGLAEGAGIRDRLDITELESFVGLTVTNLAADRDVRVHEITARVADRYNDRVAKAGLAPGLSIEWCTSAMCA
jgi:hypothetical protein